jgi:hypothetical protein
MQEKKKEKSKFFDRILQIIDFYEIKNVKTFACDYLGYSSMEKINRLQKEGTSPSYDILVDISNKFEKIRLEWLLTGKGEMLKTSNFFSSENSELITIPKSVLDLILSQQRTIEAFSHREDSRDIVASA